MIKIFRCRAKVKSFFEKTMQMDVFADKSELKSLLDLKRRFTIVNLYASLIELRDGASRFDFTITIDFKHVHINDGIEIFAREMRNHNLCHKYLIL